MASNNKIIGYIKNFLYIIICIAALAVIISGIALGITDIVIGAKFLHDECHIQELPTYLIVLGVFSIINFILFCIKKIKGEDDYSACEYLFAFMSIAIYIWGMTLVWNTELGDCPSTLYNYAYYRTIVFVFIMTAIFAITVTFITGVILCVCFCDSWLDNCIKKEPDSDIEVTNANTTAMPLGVSSNSFNDNIRQMQNISVMLDSVLNKIALENSTVVDTVCTGIESSAPKVNSSATGVTHNSRFRRSQSDEMGLEFSVSGITPENVSNTECSMA